MLSIKRKNLICENSYGQRLKIAACQSGVGVALYCIHTYFTYISLAIYSCAARRSRRPGGHWVYMYLNWSWVTWGIPIRLALEKLRFGLWCICLWFAVSIYINKLNMYTYIRGCIYAGMYVYIFFLMKYTIYCNFKCI